MTNETVHSSRRQFETTRCTCPEIFLWFDLASPIFKVHMKYSWTIFLVSQVYLSFYWLLDLAYRWPSRLVSYLWQGHLAWLLLRCRRRQTPNLSWPGPYRSQERTCRSSRHWCAPWKCFCQEYFVFRSDRRTTAICSELPSFCPCRRSPWRCSDCIRWTTPWLSWWCLSCACCKLFFVSFYPWSSPYGCTVSRPFLL